jgi:cell division protein FtsI (penicillin-binding protein 3)
MMGRTDSRLRHLAILVTFAVVGLCLVGRLAWWQVVRGADLAADARKETTIDLTDPSRRGTVYDRSGTVVLATSVDRYRLVASPRPLSLATRQRTAQTLVTMLSLTGQPAVELATRMTSDRGYVVLGRGLDEPVAREIRAGLADGTLAGLALEAEPERRYPLAGGSPDSTLAAQLLGFVNREGVGQYGVEERYQKELAGQPKVAQAVADGYGDPVPGSLVVQSAGVPGVDLRLSIDASLQLQLEQELMAAGLADSALSVSGVVMDPYTGEIYGEATYPSYDGNDYAAIAAKDPRRFIDPVVSSVYEPGSVFKMCTALAGFENGTVTPDTRINDSGTLSLDHGESKVNDADKRGMGVLPFEDIVAYSRNVGAARVAIALADSTRNASAILHKTWMDLGFGARTGIDVAGEAPGIMRDPTIRPWSQVDLANGSFGQGVAVTPIQLATAYSAMVNGGMLPSPHVVLSIGSQPVDVPQKGRIMSAEMSAQMVALMSHVLHTVPWYKANTLTPGLTMGGKTGTAQIWDAKANHGKGAWKKTYNYSFIGYVGKGRPQLVIAITIREAKPNSVSQGNLPLNVESYALYRRVATDAMATLDLPPAGQVAGSTAP